MHLDAFFNYLFSDHFNLVFRTMFDYETSRRAHKLTKEHAHLFYWPEKINTLESMFTRDATLSFSFSTGNVFPNAIIPNVLLQAKIFIYSLMLKGNVCFTHIKLWAWQKSNTFSFHFRCLQRFPPLWDDSKETLISFKFLSFIFRYFYHFIARVLQANQIKWDRSQSTWF